MQGTPTPPDRRPLDLVVWGATGFTGRLVAEELAQRGARGELPEGFAWGLGGRDRSRLDALRRQLVEIDPTLEALPLAVADSHQRPSLKALAYSTRVVATTVGPYSLHGTLLVEVAAETGTHLVDLSGEVPWMRETIDRFDELARRSGARIVHCCGFDSIPSDLGVLACHRRLQEEGRSLEAARFRLNKASGGFSGGTAASLLEITRQARESRDTRRLLADPYALNPDGERPPEGGTAQRESFAPGKDDDRGVWTAPFLMAGINTRVVHRSNALLGFPYGRELFYDERVDAGRGVSGFLRAQPLSLATWLMFTGAALAPGVMRRLLPDPGEGPSEQEREDGHFTIRVFGESGDPQGSGDRAPLEVVTTVTGTKDPGYGATAVMLLDSALCLATGEAVAKHGGVLTPATALGMPLVERLNRSGVVRFETELRAGGAEDRDQTVGGKQSKLQE
jgi:short subunit dehydrogenase-like uncharacterized protein